MSSHISPQLRQTVARRTNHVCEYCLMAEEDAYSTIDNRKPGARILMPLAVLAARCILKETRLAMKKRAKFSVALFVLGLLIQFSPARSQTQSVQQATRPRTV